MGRIDGPFRDVYPALDRFSIERIGRYARASDKMETRDVEEFERFADSGEGKRVETIA